MEIIRIRILINTNDYGKKLFLFCMRIKVFWPPYFQLELDAKEIT